MDQGIEENLVLVLFLFFVCVSACLLLASFGNRVPSQGITMTPTLIHTSFSTVL